MDFLEDFRGPRGVPEDVMGISGCLGGLEGFQEVPGDLGGVKRFEERK